MISWHSVVSYLQYFLQPYIFLKIKVPTICQAFLKYHMKLLKNIFQVFIDWTEKKKKVYKQHLGGQNKSIHKFHLFTRRPDRKFLLQENTNHKQALWSKLYTRFISNNMSAHLNIIVFFVFFSFHTFLFLNACYFLTPLFVHFNFFYTSFLSNTVNKLT